MKKIFFLLLSAVLLAACSKDDDATPVSAITFDQTTTPSSVKVGESVQLTVTITPADATDKTITWTSSDTEVATVTDAGLVTAKKAGTAIITATASNGKSAAWTITVAPVSPKLNITVTSSDIATLKAIKVVTDQNIDGDSKVKVLQVAEAQQKPAAEGTVYSIEIPSQEYGFYKIYLSEDGTTYKEAMASKSNVGEITEDQAIDYEK